MTNSKQFLQLPTLVLGDYIIPTTDEISFDKYSGYLRERENTKHMKRSARIQLRQKKNQLFVHTIYDIHVILPTVDQSVC